MPLLLRSGLKLLWAIGAALLLAVPGLGRAQSAPAFVVIVHSSNSTPSLSAEQVSRLFLKKVTKWPDGSAVLPIDLPPGSEARVQFSKQIHKRDIGAIESFWQNSVFAGRAAPPLQAQSPGEVQKYVRSHPGSVGYVPAGTALQPGVKVLEVTE